MAPRVHVQAPRQSRTPRARAKAAPHAVADPHVPAGTESHAPPIRFPRAASTGFEPSSFGRQRGGPTALDLPRASVLPPAVAPTPAAAVAAQAGGGGTGGGGASPSSAPPPSGSSQSLSGASSVPPPMVDTTIPPPAPSSPAPMPDGTDATDAADLSPVYAPAAMTPVQRPGYSTRQLVTIGVVVAGLAFAVYWFWFRDPQRR